MKGKIDQLNSMDLENMDEMSDEELQEAFAAGLLKPGLNIPCEEKEYKNNVGALKLKLEDFKLKMNWIERLDMISKPAPVPPEVYEELNKKSSPEVVKLKNRMKPNGTLSKETAMDDFQREMLFHRQAQSAVIEGISRLKSLGIPTKRPDDYFAEMAKSDQHMHKIRENLAAKQAAIARSEKISQLRRMKKLRKETQIANKQKQQMEKKQMLNEVKKFKKGLRKDLNFLENNPGKKSGERSIKSKNKRAIRDKKFGFGGKKRGSKRNTKESAAYVGSLTKKVKKSGARNNKRLGKSKRIKKRARK